MLRSEFCSWQWIYGKTPKFTVQRPLRDEESFLHIEVQKGAIEKLNFTENSLHGRDVEAWTHLLLNRNLNRELYEDISRHQSSLSENPVNGKVKEVLLSLCSTTL